MNLIKKIFLEINRIQQSKHSLMGKTIKFKGKISYVRILLRLFRPLTKAMLKSIKKILNRNLLSSWKLLFLTIIQGQIRQSFTLSNVINKMNLFNHYQILLDLLNHNPNQMKSEENKFRELTNLLKVYQWNVNLHRKKKFWITFLKEWSKICRNCFNQCRIYWEIQHHKNHSKLMILIKEIMRIVFTKEVNLEMKRVKKLWLPISSFRKKTTKVIPLRNYFD